jgi:sugar phosphate isomerase/epimerase
VDVSPAPALLDQEAAIDRLGDSVARLTRALWGRGIRLALENSRQPVAPLRAVIARAARLLDHQVPAPLICWDPLNQAAQRLMPEDPVATAAGVPVEEWFEFHFKQARVGALQGDVGEGDLDWRAILSHLVRRGYEGPALFEIPAGPDAWPRLERSAAYIRGLLQEVDPE